jgi:hypothetical protein
MLDVILQRFFDSTITNWELIVLLLVPGVIYGLRRGWQEEGFTAVGLAIVVSPLGQRFADFLLLLANRMLGVFPLGVAILLNRPPEEWPRLGDEVIPAGSVWIQAVILLLMVLVAYRAGTILGRRRDVNLLGKIMGAIFGGINGFLILARLLMLANPLEDGVVVELPTVTVMGMPASRLSNIIYGLIGFIIALFLLLAWLNRRRARE